MCKSVAHAEVFVKKSRESLFFLQNKEYCDKFIEPMSFYESLVNSVEDVVVAIDFKKRIVFLNRSGEELTGFHSENIKGERLSLLFKNHSTITPLVAKTIKEMRPISGKDAFLKIKENWNFDFTISPLIEKGNVSGAVIVLKKRPDFFKKIDDQFDSIMYLLSSVAHEIKNPLSGIRGGAQLLKRSTSEKDAKHLDIIIKETKRLDDIVKSYLFIGRKPLFNNINLHEIVEEALNVLAAELKVCEITLHRAYDPSLPMIKGDEGKLMQVFINVIKNAIEAMPSGGTLEITTKPAYEYLVEKTKKVKRRFVVVRFRDTGMGIALSDYDKIVMPFYTNKKQGSGLGLAISKKIVRDHKGLIKIKSELNTGTSVDIYLPFAG